MQSELLSIAQSGGSVIVGLTDTENTPVITRGWNVCSDGEQLSVMVAEETLIDEVLETGLSISVTSSNLISYKTIQAVGEIVKIDRPESSDLEGFQKNVEVFVESVGEALFVPAEDVKGMLPPALIRITLRPKEFFDQTPGAKK